MSFVSMQARLCWGFGRVLAHNGLQRIVNVRPIRAAATLHNPFVGYRTKEDNRRGVFVRTHASSSLAEAINAKNTEQKVVMYGKNWCGFCDDVARLLYSLDVEFDNIDLESIPEGDEMLDALFGITGSKTVPQVFVGGNFVGGCDDTISAWKSGKLKQMFQDAGVSSSL